MSNNQPETTLLPQYNATWNEYQRLVMFRLDQQDKKLEQLEAKANQIHTDIASFKTSARVTGALAGFLGSLISFIFYYFRSNSQSQ
ncbi:MAG: hypothetical protein WAQ98_21355 [Blastocatellia bacterium]